MDIPFYYDFANAARATVTPTMIQPKDNAVFQYYTRYLLKRAMSVFKWTMPKTWDKYYFLYVLYTWGYIGVISTPQFGVIPQQGALAGYDVFYRPNRILISNPNFNPDQNKQYRLGIDAEIVKLQPDYTGLLDVCQLTAARLAYAHEALYMNLINSKLAEVFLTDDKSAAQTFKLIFDQIQRGEPAVVAGAKLTTAEGKPRWQQFENNLKQNYIATDIINDMRGILNDFDSMVGIPSANTQKRERLLQDEVNANNVETESLVDVMEDVMTICVDKVNAMFGVGLSFEKRYKQMTAPEEGRSDEDNNSQSV